MTNNSTAYIGTRVLEIALANASDEELRIEMDRRNIPQPRLVSEGQPGTVLLYRVFVPWVDIDPGTDDIGYIRMSDESFMDVQSDDFNSERFTLVGGWVERGEEIDRP